MLETHQQLSGLKKKKPLATNMYHSQNDLSYVYMKLDFFS